MNTKEIKNCLAMIEKSKERIAKERDILRSLHTELEELIEDLDSGLDSLSAGLRDIEDGLDTFSKTL